MYNQNNLPDVQMFNMNNMAVIHNGLQKLSTAQGIYIKQQFETFQAITGCETPNVYKVYPADINGQQIGKNTIFKCKESSSCCARQCCLADCRPFNMTVSNQQGQLDNGSLSKTAFLQLSRPFKCTCLCFNRPELSVSYVENGQNVYLGQIRQPFKFCDLGCEILDQKGNIKFIIEGSCCQAGYLCMSCPCSSCQEYTFNVRDPSGDIVTRIQKKSAGCFKSCFGDCDDFAIGFPAGCSPEDKALFMSAALFLDYLYFENKQEEPQEKHK